VLAVATLAISGVPPFAGFFSKDAILSAAYEHAPWMFWVGVITAGMTAFYCGRAFWMTFWGEYKGHEHPHESSWTMLGPLVVLAVLSAVGGWYFNVPRILSATFPVAEAGSEEAMLTGISVAAGLIGLGLSYFMYVMQPAMPGRIASAFGGLYTLVYNKYFVDEAYNAAVVEPVVHGSEVLLWQVVDKGVIDGVVNGVGHQSQGVGGVLRRIQSGNIRSYATWVLVGAVLLLLAMGVSAGMMNGAATR
jgi:NADH-quinone oxidoreductase subunit L